eukprot:PhF_6_TR10021/c0_g1_i1/m.15339/K01897/ACSL, fadD; long-chain acyl-CoA synthetase
MEVYVKELVGEAKPLIIQPTTTVGNLRAQIHELYGVPPDHQRLISSGVELVDDTILVQDPASNVKNKTVVRLVRKWKGNANSDGVEEPAWITEARKMFSPLGLWEDVLTILDQGRCCRETLQLLKTDAKKRKDLLEAAKAKVLETFQNEIHDIVKNATNTKSVELCQMYVQKMQEYRGVVTNLSKDIEDVAAGLLDHPDFREAVDTFNALVDTITAKAKSSSVRPPWQLRYCAESDPYAKKQEVELQGGKITDADGNDIWEDACYLTGVVIQAGAFGLGIPRHRNVEKKRKVRSQFAHETVTAMAKVEEFLTILKEFDDCLGDTFVMEHDHPVWLHMKVTEAKGMTRALVAAADIYAQRPLFVQRQRVGDPFSSFTFRQAYEVALQLGDFLRETLRPGEFVGICAPNQKEWILWDIACALSEIPLIGIHTQWPMKECDHVIRQAKLGVLITDGVSEELMRAVDAQDTVVHTVVLLENRNRTITPKLGHVSKVLHYVDLVKSQKPYQDCVLTNGVTHNSVPEEVGSNPDRIFSVMYSSGTSGYPKGIVVRESSWLSDNKKPTHIYPLVILSYSALAHGMDRGMCWMALLQGGRIVFPTIEEKQIGRMNPVFTDAVDVGPSLFVAMPYVWSSLYEDYEEQLRLGSGDTSPEILLQSDRYAKCLGGRIQHVATGGAPISQTLWDFLKAIFPEPRVVLANTYGLTEAPGISTNGVVRPDVELKLVDVPEMGYVGPSSGEIVVRCKTFAKEYFRDPIRTKEMFGDPDGWVHTKDVGRLDEEGRLHIVDRVSFLIELYVQGRSVWASSSELENLYIGRIPNIRQLFLYGDRMYSFMIAIIIPTHNDAWPSEQALLAKFQEALGAETLAAAPYKVPRGAIVLDAATEWDAKSGLRGPSGKLLRDKVKAKYLNLIEKKYVELEK